MRQPRNPESIHAPLGPYTHQIELDAPSRMLALSGQGGMTPDGQVPEDAGAQLEVALANVLRNLEAAQMTAADLGAEGRGRRLGRLGLAPALLTRTGKRDSHGFQGCLAADQIGCALGDGDHR